MVLPRGFLQDCSEKKSPFTCMAMRASVFSTIFPYSSLVKQLPSGKVDSIIAVSSDLKTKMIRHYGAREEHVAVIPKWN